MSLTAEQELQEQFTDEELGQVVKSLGIRIDSLTNKVKRVEGFHRDLARAEVGVCIAALDKARKEQLSRMAA